ncbi:lysine--tRNA ligase [Candidatus Uhrbacteria bacterium]|nr:lysine--tRNA ligase [Candidatus Uhrbacteria bacterium]
MTQEEQDRLNRLQKLKDAGVDPYPTKGERTLLTQEFLDRFESLEQSKDSITLVGRVRLFRPHGGLTFAQLQDESGTVQVAFRKDHMGEEAYAFLKETIDLGDFIEVTGTAFLTRKGERSVDTTTYRLLTKTLLPLPEKWHGLQNIEQRYRQRYLDLLGNEESMRIAKLRSILVRYLREFFNDKGFFEVETPILQPLYGGANAKPFVTHHNALDMKLYLRIAPELYLKRLIVGGFEKVYEIARCFRNEGIDHNHNPEFTQIEYYWAYANYEDSMNLVEELIPFLFKSIGLDLKLQTEEGEIDFTPPYPRKTMRALIMEYADVDIEDFPDQASMYEKVKSLQVHVESFDGRGKMIDELYKKFVRPHIKNPLFMIDHPVDLSPLAKRKPDDARYVERFQLLCVGGNELCNAFSELNDPLDQEERFKEQARLVEAGDEEGMPYDEDYITALKHGMPPTTGLGLGIDRFVKLLVNAPNLKEVILFPILRSEQE